MHVHVHMRTCTCMQVEYEGMANDYTVTPVDDPLRASGPSASSHCEKSGVRNHIRPAACERHDRETVTQVDGQ